MKEKDIMIDLLKKSKSDKDKMQSDQANSAN